MTNSFNKIIRTFALAVSALAGSQLALHAIPISGKVEMQGVIGLNDTSLLDATSTVVDAVNPEASVIGATATGAYTGTGGAAVEWKAFSWAPISPLPISSLWSFSSGGLTYSFDLTALSVVSHTSTFLDVAGAGTLKIQGPGSIYDDTVGQWTFQITNASGSSANAQFIFQSSNATPDGGTTAVLIGLSLVGLSVFSQRRRFLKA